MPEAKTKAPPQDGYFILPVDLITTTKHSGDYDSSSVWTMRLFMLNVHAEHLVKNDHEMWWTLRMLNGRKSRGRGDWSDGWAQSVERKERPANCYFKNGGWLLSTRTSSYEGLHSFPTARRSKSTNDYSPTHDLWVPKYNYLSISFVFDSSIQKRGGDYEDFSGCSPFVIAMQQNFDSKPPQGKKEQWHDPASPTSPLSERQTNRPNELDCNSLKIKTPIFSSFLHYHYSKLLKSKRRSKSLELGVGKICSERGAMIILGTKVVCTGRL